MRYFLFSVIFILVLLFSATSASAGARTPYNNGSGYRFVTIHDRRPVTYYRRSGRYHRSHRHNSHCRLCRGMCYFPPVYPKYRNYRRTVSPPFDYSNRPDISEYLNKSTKI